MISVRSLLRTRKQSTRRTPESFVSSSVRERAQSTTRYYHTREPNMLTSACLEGTFSPSRLRERHVYQGRSTLGTRSGSRFEGALPFNAVEEQNVKYYTISRIRAPKTFVFSSSRDSTTGNYFLAIEPKTDFRAVTAFVQRVEYTYFSQTEPSRK